MLPGQPRVHLSAEVHGGIAQRNRCSPSHLNGADVDSHLTHE